MQIQFRSKANASTVGRQVGVVIQEIFGYPLGEYLGPSRLRKYMQARRTFYMVMRDLGYSMSQIARLAGRSDHTAILHGLNVAAHEIRTDEEYKMLVNRVRLNLGVAEGRDTEARQDMVVEKNWRRLPMYLKVAAEADQDADG